MRKRIILFFFLWPLVGLPQHLPYYMQIEGEVYRMDKEVGGLNIGEGSCSNPEFDLLPLTLNIGRMALDFDHYELTFNDEFNGSGLNSDLWDDYTRHQNWGPLTHSSWGPQYNPQSCEYTSLPDNFLFANGRLILHPIDHGNAPLERRSVDWVSDADPIPGGDGLANKRNFRFSSGMIESKRLFKHGFFEFKVKLPSAFSVWPAIWLYSGPSEIDVLEMTANNINNFLTEPDDIELPSVFNRRVFFTYHSTDFPITSSNCSTSPNSNEIGVTSGVKILNVRNLTDIPVSLAFKELIFQLYWDDYKIIWLVNGVEVYTVYHYYLHAAGGSPTSPDFLGAIPITNRQLFSQLSQNWSSNIYYNRSFPETSCRLKISLGVKNQRSNFGSTPNNGKYSILSPGPLYPGNLSDFEIDYVRVWEFNHCNEDIVLDHSDSRRYDIPNNLRGNQIVIGGANNHFAFDGNFWHQTDPLFQKSAEILAQQRIHIKPGFSVTNGSRVHLGLSPCQRAASFIQPFSAPSQLNTNKVVSLPSDSIYQIYSIDTMQLGSPDSIKVLRNVNHVGFKVYPSPFSRNLVIQSHANAPIAEYQLLDLSGRIVFESINSESAETILISDLNLSDGVYLLKCKFHSGTVLFRKLICFNGQ
jgi:hypothetical protein